MTDSCSFYVFLSSDDSLALYPSNQFHDYITELPREIRLEECAAFGFKRKWRVALTELTLTPGAEAGDKRDDPILTTIAEPIVVFADIAAPSIIKGREIQILRTFNSAVDAVTSLHMPYYVGVSKNNFRRIRIKFYSRELEAIDLKLWPTEIVSRCILHFTVE